MYLDAAVYVWGVCILQGGMSGMQALPELQRRLREEGISDRGTRDALVGR